jgi:Tfp pilus assembly protein PilF
MRGDIMHGTMYWIALAWLLAAPPLVARGAPQADDVRRAQALQRYRSGQEYLRAEQFDNAAREFAAAIELDPLLALAHYGLGQSYMASKRYASAIQAFTGCREAYHRIIDMREGNRMATDRRIDDEIRELQNGIAMLRGGRFKGYGNPDTKITELEARIDELRRIQQEPVTQFRPPAEVSLALGSAYFRSGNLESAESEWRAAVAVNPKLGEAHNNLAVIYMQTGRLDAADQELKLAEKNGFRVNPQFKADLRQRQKRIQN